MLGSFSYKVKFTFLVKWMRQAVTQGRHYFKYQYSTIAHHRLAILQIYSDTSLWKLSSSKTKAVGFINTSLPYLWTSKKTLKPQFEILV